MEMCFLFGKRETADYVSIQGPKADITFRTLLHITKEYRLPLLEYKKHSHHHHHYYFKKARQVTTV